MNSKRSAVSSLDGAESDPVIGWFTGEDMIEALTGADVTGAPTGEDMMREFALDIDGNIGDLNQNVSQDASNWQPDSYSFQQPQGLQFFSSQLGFSVPEPQFDPYQLQDRLTASLVIPTGGAAYQMGFDTGLQSTSSQNEFDVSGSYVASHASPGESSAKRNRRNQRSPRNSTSINRGLVKKKSGSTEKFHPGKVIVHLEKVLRSCPEMSVPSKQKFGILLRQFKLLVEETELQQQNIEPKSPGRQSTDSGNTTFLTESISSPNRFAASTENDVDISSSPRQATHDACEEILVDSKHEKESETIYWCTKEGCGYSIQSEVDWKRHEQNDTHWPQECFICLQCPRTAWDPNENPTCSFCLSLFLTTNDLQLHYLDCESAKKGGKTFGRKDHFCKHLREKHFIQDTTHFSETWKYPIFSNWPRQCGYCGYSFQNWNQRTKHIADHYRKGAKLENWKLPFPRRDYSNKAPDFHQSDDDSNGDDDEAFGGRQGEKSGDYAKYRNIPQPLPMEQSLPQRLENHQESYAKSCQGSRNKRQCPVIAESLLTSEERTDLDDSAALVQPSLALQRYLNDNGDRSSGIWISDSTIVERPLSLCTSESLASSSATIVAKRSSNNSSYTQKWVNNGYWAAVFESSESNIGPLIPSRGRGYTFAGSHTPQGLFSAQLQSPQQLDPSREATELLTSDSPGQRENISAGAKGELSTEQLGDDNHPKKGCRIGRLSPEHKKKAAQMRILGACSRCRLNRIPCSSDVPCRSCQKMVPSPWHGRLCIRERFDNYTKLFFPDLITSRLTDTSIDALIKERVAGFTNNAIEINVSSGPKYPTMSLTVYEFVARNKYVSDLSYIPSANSQGLKGTTTSLELPVCLLQPDLRSLQEKCLNHVKTISKMPRYVQETTRGDTWIVVWQAINAVTKFQRESEIPSQNDFFLHEATMLYTMNHIMSQTILLTKDSAKNAAAKLLSPALSFDPKILSSSLLNLQIKSRINVLLQEMTGSVLRQLEKVLMNVKGKISTWANSFCVMFVLCTCIESVQVATDAFVVSKLHKKEQSKFSRQDYFFNLEGVVFHHCVELFHTAYRTRKFQTQRGFNPIRDGLELDCERGITQPMVGLVAEMKLIIHDHKNDMKLRAEAPSLGTWPDLLSSHMDFRKRNSGRLVSKFLLSFDM